MRKALRILGKILLGLVALILLVVAAGYVVSSIKLRKRYAIAPAKITVPTDSASLERGFALATLHRCNGCHGRDLGGHLIINQFPTARLAGPNLTRGRGGVGTAYSDADWERAIRHGVRRNGEPLFLMPSVMFNRLRDEDVGQIIAYVKSVPPVDRTVPGRTIYPLFRVVHMIGAPLVDAEAIDHSRQVVVAPPPGATLEYGRFVSLGCRFCHGQYLKGKTVGGDPGAPPSPDISSTGAPGRWTDAQFIQALRTGVTPTGRRLVEQFMPWPGLGKLSDDELRGLWMYLQASDSLRAAAKK
jgi:cytochrome c553